MIDEKLQNAIDEIRKNHRKIIDDWCKAYMAQLYEEGHDIKPGSFTLCEQLPGMYNGQYCQRYWFKPGIPEYAKANETPYIDGYFPPPWNPMEHPEKTEGWIAFQQALRDDPKYYNEKETT